MESAPDTVHKKVFDSQHSGATALVTADAQVPMITGTLSTSISLWAARTAASGLVWSSSTIVSILRPRTPSPLLTSSITACIALSMRGPSCPPAPVSGVRMPNLSASTCAVARPGNTAATDAAVAPCNRERRVTFVIGGPLWRHAENTRPMSATEKEPSDFRIDGESLGGAGYAVLAIDQDVGAVGDGERLVGILLDHDDRDAIAINLHNGVEQTLGSHRR